MRRPKPVLFLGVLLLLCATGSEAAFTPPRMVGVMNHTDSGDLSAAELADRRLSEQRAQQITKYLVDQYTLYYARHGGSQGRYGEAQPIVPNNTADNKALNRRIEVIVWE